MGRLCCPPEAAEPVTQVATSINDSKRYAVSHKCCADGDSQCITLIDGQNGALGCYRSNVLLGRSSTDEICFKDRFTAQNGCTYKGCGEKQRHIHASVPGGPQGSFEHTLVNCGDCDAGSASACVANVIGRSQHKSLLTSGDDETKTVMEVSGICCPSEIPVVERALAKLPGIIDVNVNVTSKYVTVIHDSQSKDIDLVEALNRASLGARLKRDANGSDGSFNDRCPSPLLVVCGLLWFVSLASFAGHGNDSWLGNLKYTALGSIAFGLPRIAMKALGAIRTWTLDINCLMTLAAGGAVAVGDYVEGGAVVFLFGLSEYLEHMASAKARNALRALLDMKPEQATLVTGKKVAVEQVNIGDRLKVVSGEKIPVDGVVEEGSSSLDESALTGESRPVSKSKGSAVSAGTVNIGGGYLEMTATATSQNSTVARMVKLIEEANASRSKTEKRVEAFAKIYTPVVLIGAVACATVPWLFTDTDTALEWVYTSLVLLVVACPCALVISTPMTYVCTLTTAASHGILVRGGEHLEALGSVAAIGLDKTGTLTEGRFLCREAVGPFTGSRSKSEWPKLLTFMAAVEQKSSHPVAAALVAHCKAGGADLNKVAVDAQDKVGEGVEAMVDGTRVQVGSRRLAQRMGWLASESSKLQQHGSPQQTAGCFPIMQCGGGKMSKAPLLDSEAESQVTLMESQGYTVCYLGVDGQLAAIFGVADVPRVQSPAALKGLKLLGVETVMLTGDRRPTAEAVAKQLGVSRVQAELMPRDKVTAVMALKEERKGSRSLNGVAMVGDGVNDAAALAASTVGVAMGAAGTQVAVESAHVVLMDSDLRKLVLAIKLGRHAVFKIKQNITFSIVSKAIMLGLTFGGYASLWAAIGVDLGSMLIVTLNSCLVLNQRRKKEHVSSEEP